MIARARGWWKELRAGEITITDLAKREGLTKSYVSRLVRLAFLSPEVTRAALAGDLRDGVDAAALKLDGAIALSWDAQRRALLPAT